MWTTAQFSTTMEMNPIFAFVDPFLIWFYRLTGNAFPDFVIGTTVLAFFAVLIGEFCISLAFLAARKKIDKTSKEVVHYQNLSMKAIASGDKSSYTAANKLANDAFGKSFFLQISLSGAFLWPVFFAIAWMQPRFRDVEFQTPFEGYTVGFLFFFVIIYIVVCVIFKKFKYRLPYFKSIKATLDTYERSATRLKTPADYISEPKREQ
jgi:hypothetical protein